MNKRKPVSATLLYVLLLLFSGSLAHAQKISQMEFRNQAISDILLVLAEVSGVSIVPDETVSGTASFFFHETEFRVALESFLSAQKLYLRDEGNIIYVSRIQIDQTADGVFSMHADEVDVQLLLRALSRTARKTILFDTLPRLNLSIHAEELSLARILDIMLQRLPEYELRSSDDSFYLRKRDPVAGAPGAARPASGSEIRRNADGSYNLDFEQLRLRDALVSLMQLQQQEYVSLISVDSLLTRMNYTDRSFEQTLQLILEQVGADFVVLDGLVYIFEIQKRDITKKLRNTIVVDVRYLPVQDVVFMLPQELSNSAFYRMDKTTNSFILTGSEQELAPLVDFIRQVDQPLVRSNMVSFRLSYIKAREFLALCPPRLFPTSPILPPDEYLFVADLPTETVPEVEQLLRLLDVKQAAVPVRLKFLSNSALLEVLPPSVSKDDILDTGYPGLVFYRGTQDKLEQFLTELALVDRPAPQLRYDVLVLQSQLGNSFDFKIDLSARRNTASDSFAVIGAFEKLLSVNFDLISEFGYLFATKVSLELAQSTTRIFADTTLTGLAGQDIKFQNTETFRYVEPERDPDTGALKNTGITREITSGLILSINGWISSDNMVTMKTTATVSERGTTDGASDRPPATFERVVSSQLRTPAGVPVPISGLIQRKKTRSIRKIPLLGDIPLLGLLFRYTYESDDETEYTIYIVPRLVEDVRQPADSGGRMMDLYRLVSVRP